MRGQIYILLALMVMATSSCKKGLHTNLLLNKDLVGKTYAARVALKSPSTGGISTVYHTLQFVSRTEVLSSERIKKEVDTNTKESLLWEIDGIDERGIIVHFKDRDHPGTFISVKGAVTNIGLSFEGYDMIYELVRR